MGKLAVLSNSSEKQGRSGPTQAKSVADGCEVSYSEARAPFALHLMKITRVIQKAAMHRSFGLNAPVAYLRSAERQLVKPSSRPRKTV